jgi:WD40 repeat protein/serine/threonine protein kinase/Flp pilus assembly protein TadD
MGMDYEDRDRLKREIMEALKAEQWEEALPKLEMWCEHFPDQSRSWLNRGYCLVRLERYAEAVSALDRCLDLDPSSTTAQGWRKKALQALDAAHSVAKAPAATVAAQTPSQPLGDATRFVPDETAAPPSFATISAPDQGRGWLVGTVVDGRYEVRQVARGGMAVVSIAFDRELQRMVAVKTPLPSVLATEDGRARFQREAESWIALGVHPNICSAYYLQEIGGMPRLFIEYVDGGDLSDWLRQDERPSLEQRFDIAIQIASGLDYTHNFLWTNDDGVEHTGVVHRDIKPANVLLTKEGIARVTDFGLVRAEVGDEVAREEDVRQQVEPKMPHSGRSEDASMASGSWQTVTVDGGLVGTPPYMAPELWRQSLRGTIATDMYAYGCMLYEIFCGRRPFMMPTDGVSRTREAQLSGWMRLHLREEPPDPLQFEPGLEQRLAALMRACVAKDPRGRPQSFSLLRGWMVEMYRDATGRPYPRPEPQRTQLLADSLNNRGVSFITLGLEERAAGSFRDALDADPRHLEANFNSSLLEWRRDGLTDAELERRLGEAERTLGDPSRSSLLRARLRLLLDDPEGAVKALGPSGGTAAEAHASRRERGLAVLSLARSGGGRADDLERARELLSAAMETSPSDVAIVVGLAEIYARLGNKEVTKEAMTRARALDPEIGDGLPEAVANHLPGHWLTRSMSHHAPVQGFLALPNGWLVVRSVAGDASVWEASGDRPVHRIDLGGPARQGRSMTVIDDVLVVCLENSPLTLFDLANGQRLRNLRTHPGVATCVAAAPDRRAVASGGSDRNLRLWDLESGECVRTFQGHEAFVSSVAWDPSGSRVVSASADGTLRVWDLDQERCVQILEGHRGPIRDVAIAGDGRVALSAGQDGSVGVWDLVEGSHIRFMRGHSGAVTTVALGGDVVAAGGDDCSLRLWNLSSGETLRIMRLANPVQAVALTDVGRRLTAAHGSSVSQILLPSRSASRLPLVLADTAASGELAGREQTFRQQLDLAREHIDAGAMEEAIEPLRAARAVTGYELHQEALELWNTVLAYFPKHAPRSVVELRRVGGGTVVNACRLTADGASCLAGGSDGSLRIFETATGVEQRILAGHGNGVTSVAVSDSGLWLASAGRDGWVRVWDTGDGIGRHEFEGHEGIVQAVVFEPDSNAVISAGDDGSARLWPLEEGSLPELLGRSDDAMTALAVSRDGRFVVGGGWDSQVTVWSLPRREELRRMAGHEGAINALAVSPDCRIIASAGEDGSIRLWDISGGRCWRILTGHEGGVHAVAFTPDARFLLSAGKDATLRLWDIRTGTAERVIEGHAGPIFDVALSHDGGAALTAGSDATLRLWFLDWEPEPPERGRWDDRARPFLEVFLRRREGETVGEGAPTWSDEDLEGLVKDLGRRGFGWLSSEMVERELEGMARNRVEQRSEEQKRTRELARQRQRQVRVAPAKEIVGRLTKNIGLKLAGVAAAVIVVLLGIVSLRAPDSGEATFNHKLHSEVSILVRERTMRLKRGMVLSYQNRPTMGITNCADGIFGDFLSFVLHAERRFDPPLDPGVPAEDIAFRDMYAGYVNCVGMLGDQSVVDDLLQRSKSGLHPYRLEDLLSVMVRVAGGEDPQVIDALDDRSETTRHFAALAIIHGGNRDGIQTLVEGLDSDDRRLVEGTSYVLVELIALGALDEAAAFEAVRRLSRNIDPKVRQNAVRALVHFERRGAAREVLDEALEDSDPEVREIAERTLNTIRSAKMYELFG